MKITEIFKCNFCNRLLTHPVTLPCGDSVCLEHISKLLEDYDNGTVENYKFVLCKKCNDPIVVPKNGLKINTILEMLLQREIEKLNLIKYHEATKSCIELRNAINTYEKIKADPRGKINKDFDTLRNRVDSTRNEIKTKVDDIANKLIINLKGSQNESTEYTINNAKYIFKNFDEIKRRVNAWIPELERFEVDETKCKDILSQTSRDLPLVKSELTSLDTKLINSNFYEIDRHLNSLYLDSFKKL
jgi:hypothetical protein